MSSNESPISSFIPSITSSHSAYPSLSYNHIYNRASSSCGLSIPKTQSTTDSTFSEDNFHHSDIQMQNTGLQLFREPMTKCTKQHPNNSTFDPLKNQQGVWSKPRLQRYFPFHMPNKTTTLRLTNNYLHIR